jgi:hypothetical protein
LVRFVSRDGEIFPLYLIREEGEEEEEERKKDLGSIGF